MSTDTLTKEQLREILCKDLPNVVENINAALGGDSIANLEPSLARLGRGGKLPHWYEKLKTDHALPNMDGKTVGSVIEMLLVAVLDTHTFANRGVPPLKINPARGVDIPALDLGVKSPSENFCTSEPFFSAYERLLGTHNDVLLLLTNYQSKKKGESTELQIIKHAYLTTTQVADKNLCLIARTHRDWLVNKDESRAKRVLRFLAYVNQSDWRAKVILSLIAKIRDDDDIQQTVKDAEKKFAKMNKAKVKKDEVPLPDEELHAIKEILDIKPFHIGIIDAADNWVVETKKDAARAPSEDEWSRFLISPLDGRIGMSLALQWRYDFGPVFGVNAEPEEVVRLL